MIDFAPTRNLFRQRAHIPIRSVAFIHFRREVAIRTSRATEGNVDINSSSVHISDYRWWREWSANVARTAFSLPTLSRHLSCESPLFEFYAACMISSRCERNAARKCRNSFPIFVLAQGLILSKPQVGQRFSRWPEHNLLHKLKGGLYGRRQRQKSGNEARWSGRRRPACPGSQSAG